MSPSVFILALNHAVVHCLYLLLGPECIGHVAIAASSSANSRKRSDSESEEAEGRHKQARTELRNLVIVRPGSRRWIFPS